MRKLRAVGIRLCLCAFIFAALLPLPAALAQAPGVRHIVIIGVDGMSPDGVIRAATPNMDALMARGAWSMKARAVIPTVSSPNWASMIMGAGPAQHGITSNEWLPLKHEIEPTAVSALAPFFPTIFGVIRQQRPEAVISLFHDWNSFPRFVEAKAVDLIFNGEGPDETMQRALAYIKEKKPLFCFIHLDHVDHAGHSIGWGTPEYLAAVEKADALIGDAARAIEEAGILNETVLLVTSDHGGKDKGHGGSTMEELLIPWIIAGPGIAKGREIEKSINTYDTAATVAHLLGLEPPEAWIARPVLAAME